MENIIKQIIITIIIASVKEYDNMSAICYKLVGE